MSLKNQKVIQGFSNVVEKQSKLIEVMNEKMSLIMETLMLKEEVCLDPKVKSEASEELKKE